MQRDPKKRLFDKEPVQEPTQDTRYGLQSPAVMQLQQPSTQEGTMEDMLNQPEQQPGGGAEYGVPSGIQPTRTQRIGKEQVQKAEVILKRYKAGKERLERRIINDQQWWKLRNWEQMNLEEGLAGSGHYKSNTGWLWNCIVGKHADAMDAFPEPIVLPRAEDDKDEAKRLSEVIPVILDMNGFQETYSDCAWQKLQEGTGIYGVAWDSSKNNGMGDISVTRINALNLFWQPGIADIQDSRHVFLCSLEDNDILEQQYPQLEGKTKGENMTLAKYMYDDNVDTSDKSVVVDWYYHTYNGGRKLLHYVKFCGETVLYASEDDPEYADRGYYDDGMYPFVFDALYPVEGSPCGIGLIDIGKGSQMDIDLMNQAMVRNTTMSSTPRYFIRSDGSVNEQEFSDWSKPMVHVEGNLSQDTVMPISTTGLQNLTVSFLQGKIEELKFVTGNVDVNNGSTPSGVTAASAIAALKADAGKSSADSNRTSYRAYRRLVTMVIERIRQFYDLPRQMRITGERGEERYTNYSNEALKPQPQGSVMGVDMGMRLPVFDIDVRAQRETAYTKTAQNELALQFFQLGFFNPSLADQALMTLDMMDFRGKEEVIGKVQQGQTLMQVAQQMGQLAAMIAQQNGDQEGMQAVQMLMQQASGGAAPMMQAGAPAGVPDGEQQYGSAEYGSNAKRMNDAAKSVSEAKIPQ